MSTLKITALAALLTSAAAFAQDPQPTQPEATPPADQTQPADETMATEGQWPEFTTLDANGDGYVSKDEAKANAQLTANWDALDTDKNGALSSAEYQKAKDSGKK
jgi:EF hand